MDRIVVVTKPTRLEELILRHHTEGMAKFVLGLAGKLIDPYKREHDAYQEALTTVHRQIPNDVPVTTVRREGLPNFLFRDTDLVLVCGPDGLFVNTAKYLGQQLVLTVNPDPMTVAGVLMLFAPHEVRGVIATVAAGTQKVERLPFAKAMIDNDNERVVWGVNDIFIGRTDPMSARYEVSFGDAVEHQSSSGIIVSTGVGSTGWIRSIAAMVQGLTREGQSHKLSLLPEATSNELVFAVREPFPSPNTGTSIVTGRVLPGKPLVVSSEMPEGGFIFSDGVIEQAIEWNAGSKVEISVGDRYVQRIVR